MWRAVDFRYSAATEIDRELTETCDTERAVLWLTAREYTNRKLIKADITETLLYRSRTSRRAQTNFRGVVRN